MNAPPPTALTDGGADSSIAVGASRVYGLPVDSETRCVHWHGPNDVIALGFPCCDRLYPCRECHDDVADHPAVLWTVDRQDADAILCGACATLFPIADYLRLEACPHCGAGFNPGCRLHHHLYFDWVGDPRTQSHGGPDAGRPLT